MSLSFGFQRSLFPGFLCVALLGGCDPVGPNYIAPTDVSSASFVNGGSSELREAASIAWWKELRDPQLNSLISRGLDQNLSISASLQRIEAAQALLRGTGVNSQTDGSLSGSKQRVDNGLTTRTIDSGTLNASYVFDLFGGFRRGTEEAQANVGAAQFSSEVVKLGFLAELVSAYIEARFFQNAAEINRQVLASQRETRRLVQVRLDAGEAAPLELEQANQIVEQTAATLPILNASFEASVFRIATLLAEPAGPILARMKRGARLPAPRRFGGVGIPADLLRNRPDVRFAERNYAAATARIGIAEAQLYPSLVLSGSVTASSPDTWRFGPAFTVPVFNRGLLTARRDAAIANAKETEITWREAVFVATEDVQVAITQGIGFRRQTEALRKVEGSAKRLLGLARTSYELGAAPITDVIDGEIAVSNARSALLESRRNAIQAWVQLQIATGKGWLAR